MELKVFICENLNDTLKMKSVILHFRHCRFVTSQLSDKYTCNVTLRVQDDFFAIRGRRSNILSFYQMRVEEIKNTSAYRQYDVVGESYILISDALINDQCCC